jgi:hypothetical protein
METASSSPASLPLGDASMSPTGEASAYLIVHAESTEPAGRRSRRGLTPFQRLCALYPSSATTSVRSSLSLTLGDRQGRTVLSLAKAEPVLGIALSPGTYHLTATRGGARRGCTVSLPAGSRFDLYSRFAATERMKQTHLPALWPVRSIN